MERPSSSMRLRAWTATSTSVARRGSVRERSPSPITCLNLLMTAWFKAGSHVELGKAGLTLPGGMMAP